MSTVATFICGILFLLTNPTVGHEEAKLLYETLMTGYNKLIRPMKNRSVVEVKLKLKLSQLLDVHEKNQIMTTNVWLTQEWTDDNFRWDPEDFGGISKLHIPSSQIWLPDIVLYNNADGNYQVRIMTKALVESTGLVRWSPPSIYRSMCQINVRWFPFDEQHCELKFGSWTYDGLEVDLIDAARIDLSDFYESVEWDIMGIPSERHQVKFDCCLAPYIDITYSINLRRKTLFYTVNLIIPSVGLSLLTVTVFYLPSDSGEKVVLCISILISLTVFFLLLVEIIPSTSLVIPLIGLYLLFTMVMVTCSIAVTVVTLNFHHRSPSTHRLPRWIRLVFLRWLPLALGLERPSTRRDHRPEDYRDHRARPLLTPEDPLGLKEQVKEKQSSPSDGCATRQRKRTPSGDKEEEVAPHKEALKGLLYVAGSLRSSDAAAEAKEDWRFVSAVLDRLFLWIFGLVCVLGTGLIVFRAPIIYDTRAPLV